MYEILLKYLEQFVHLSPEEFTTLKGRLEIKQFAKKQLLVKEGDTATHLYFVTNGLIHQYFLKGKEMITTDLVGEATITGSVTSFLSGRPSHYFLQALEPTTVLALSKQHLEELYAVDKKWQKIGRVIITHFLLKQENNILDDIRYTVRERLVNFATNYPDIINKVPQRRIASYLHIKPETYTRLKPLISDSKKETGPRKKTNNP